MFNRFPKILKRFEIVFFKFLRKFENIYLKIEKILHKQKTKKTSNLGQLCKLTAVLKNFQYFLNECKTY